MPLGKYLNSNYIKASNALNGKKARRKVIAYVESYDDVFFWRSILSTLETPERYFQVMLPARGHKLERGKKAVLMSAFKDSVGPDMIACVDADYDYLKQGSNIMSQEICYNPYVFHTYAYSIENLQCWASSLHEVCVMVTLVDSPDILDFERFLSRFSEIIYPLFVWNILFARHASYGDFGMTDFIKTIQTGTVVKHHVNETLKRLENKVGRKLKQIEVSVSTKAKIAYKELLEEMEMLGVNQQETYLYIQGHSLFNDIIVPMLTKVCDHLINEREQEIRIQSKHATQEENELSCYENSLEAITSMLKKNTLYLSSPHVKRIIEEIKTKV